MEVTALGHAGLRVAGADTVGLIDPWLSRRGAFLGSWYQLPAPDHLDTATVLTPDWVVVTSDREDRLDLATLARIPAGTPLFVPAFPSKRLLDRVRAHTTLRVVEVGAWMRVPLGDAGSWLTLVPAQSPAQTGAAVLVTIDGETLFDCNDARLTIAQARRGRLALGGVVDLAAITFTNPALYPLCMPYVRELKAELDRQRRDARFGSVSRLLDAVQPRLTVPIGAPPCFLDPALADLNAWIATPERSPAPPQVTDWFHEHEPRFAFTTMLPGDRCLVRDQLVLDDPTWEGFSYDRLPQIVHDYAHLRAVELSRLYATHPEPDDELDVRFAAHIEELASMSRYFLERIDMTVRFDVLGPGGGEWDVHLRPDAAHVDLHGGATDVQQRITVESRWLAAVVDGRATWDELLNSLRLSVARDPDTPNDHLFWLLRHADRNALLSIEAYERSHDLAEPGRRRGASAAAHFDDDGDLGDPTPAFAPADVDVPRSLARS